MLKHATFAQAGAATRTVKLVAVANVIPAFTAFYGSIDELKHPGISVQNWRSKPNLSTTK
jgi:hypothetical protein